MQWSCGFYQYREWLMTESMRLRCVCECESVLAPYRGPCRRPEASGSRACSCKQHLGSSPSLVWWCHSWAPLLESLDCFRCLGSRSSGSGGKNKVTQETGRTQRPEMCQCYLDLSPGWGFSLIIGSSEHGRSFEKTISTLTGNPKSNFTPSAGHQFPALPEY